jgi:acyl carrier protein
MAEAAEELIEYIRRELIRRPDVQIDSDTPLVSSGLIDSFSLVDILSKLEAARVSPQAKSNPRTWTRCG